MRVKYGQTKFYYDWLLNNLALAGRKNRMRMKFLNILVEKNKEFQLFEQSLIKEHANLDEQGNIKILNPDENGFGEPDFIDKQAFDKAHKELLNEEFVVEENETNADMLTILKVAIEECPTEWSGQDAADYEIVASLFDGIYDGEGV